MSDAILKPCPFCGDKLHVSSRGTGRMKSAQHPSSDCILSGQGWWLVPRFVGPWNTRANVDEV